MAAYEGFADLERGSWQSDGISKGYTDLFSPASDLAIPEIIASLDHDQRILDLCCGQGNVTAALIKAGHSVIGADFSPNMLKIARHRNPDGEFVTADAQDLPFDQAEFDVVTCSFGLMHVPDQPRALKQIRRVLKPGGKFVMTSWCGPDISPAFQVLYGSVQKFGDPSVKMPDSPDFHQYADVKKAENILAEAKLSLQNLQQINCYWILKAPHELAEIYQDGAPRAGYLLRQQPKSARDAIKKAVTHQVEERFKEGGHWKVPVPAAMIVATAE